MKLAYKIYLIILIFLIPLAATIVYFIVTGNSKDIDFVQQEKCGNQFQRPLENILDHLTQRLAADLMYRQEQKKEAQQERATFSAMIDQDMKDLENVNQQFGERLGFSSEMLEKHDRKTGNVKNVENEWNDIKQMADGPVPKDFWTKYNTLIGDVNLMISQSGDISNLILDPELDTYYLISATLADLPGQHSRFPDVLQFTADLLQRKNTTIADRKALAVYSAMLTGVDLSNTNTHVNTALKQQGSSPFGGAVPTFEPAVKPKLDQFNKSTNDLAAQLDKFSDAEKTDKELKDFLPLLNNARDDSFKLWTNSIDQLDKLLDRRLDYFANRRTIALAVLAVLLLLAAGVSYVIIRQITHSVVQVAGELHELAGGDADLTKRIQAETRDEIGELALGFNTLMENLLGLVRQVQQSGAQVTSSSTQIAASTKELEAALTEQAASTNEVVATSKEISATSQSLVQTMSEVSKVASETAALAGSGKEGLEGMETTMHQLSDSTTSISTRLSAISDKANNINKIVTTITKVADQTNLLSLNASIEAEKAGEHGLGFAVVAREIRRLADQTAVATLDIERMVKEMQSAVSTGVMEMDKFTREVGQGVGEVNKLGEQLATIIERVQALAPRVETVTDGMQAQSQGAMQISSAMIQLSDAAKQTMDSLRQTNSAILELNSAARGLHDEVSRFKTSA